MATVLNTQITLNQYSQLGTLADTVGLVSGTWYVIAGQYIQLGTQFQYQGFASVTLNVMPIGVPAAGTLVTVSVGTVPTPAVVPPPARYPYEVKERVLASNLNLDLSSSPGNTPPNSAHGNATRGKLWLDTSVSPAALRVCAVPAASAGYVANEWFTLATPTGGGSGDYTHGGTIAGNLTVTGNVASGGSIGVTGSVAGLNFQARDDASQNWLWWASGGSARLTLNGTDRAVITSAGFLTMSGAITAGDEVNSTGANAALGFNARDNAGQQWLWYATGNSARLWQGGDKLWVNNAGVLNTASDIYCGGGLHVAGLLTANGGITSAGTIQITSGGINQTGTGGITFAGGLTANGSITTTSLTCSSIHNTGNTQVDGTSQTNGNMSVGGILQVGGIQLYNSNGQLYTSNGGYRAAGVIQSDAGGDAIIATNGNIHAAGTLVAGGELTVSGTYCHVQNVDAANDINARGVFRRFPVGGGQQGARIEAFGGGWNYMVFAVESGGPVGLQLDVAADVGSTNFTIFGDAVSDARLKTNIRDSEIDALAAIVATPIRAWEWNEEGEKQMPGVGPLSIGLVAQEVEATMPDVVFKQSNNPALNRLDDLRMISDQRVIPYLWRAIQQLEARLAALEGTV